MRRGWAYFCLVMMGLLFGAMTPIAKAAMEGGIPQFTLTGLRMWGATVFFWCWSWMGERVPVPRRDLALMALAAFLGIVCDQGLFILGLSYTSPIDAGVICTMIPVFALVLGVFFKGERPSWCKVVAIGIGLVGAVVMVLSSAGTDAGSGTVYGDLIVITALVCFSCYLVFFTELIARYPIQILMRWLFLFSAVMMTPLLVWDTQGADLGSISSTAWWEVTYVIVGGTILAFLCMVEGQRHCSPEVVGVFNYLQPVVTCVLTVAMGLGNLTLTKISGAALIFISVYLVSQIKR